MSRPRLLPAALWLALLALLLAWLLPAAPPWRVASTTFAPAQQAATATPALVWATKASMAVAREGLGLAAASNGKLYAIGGVVAGGDGLTTVEEYDPATNAWTTKAGMLAARGYLGIATAGNGKLYAAGGISGTGNSLATLEEYDPAANAWTTKASMSGGRHGLALVAAANGKLYAIGGIVRNGGPLATVEEYDPATNAWASRAPMPGGRAYFGLAAAPNGKVYAIGGYGCTGVGTGCTTVEEHDPTSNTWTAKAPLPTGRYNLGVATAGNGRIYAIGGATASGPSNAVEEYDPATNTWTAKASMPTARDSLGVAAASNGKLYAIGGNDPAPQPSAGLLAARDQLSPGGVGC